MAQKMTREEARKRREELVRQIRINSAKPGQELLVESAKADLEILKTQCSHTYGYYIGRTDLFFCPDCYLTEDEKK